MFLFYYIIQEHNAKSDIGSPLFGIGKIQNLMALILFYNIDSIFRGSNKNIPNILYAYLFQYLEFCTHNLNLNDNQPF